MGVLFDPFPGQGFEVGRHSGAGWIEAAVAFDLTHLLAHSCAEQCLFVGERDTNPVAVFNLPAPGHIARIAGIRPYSRHVHQHCGAASPGARAIACDATEADSVQPLRGDSRVIAWSQFDGNIIWMR